MWPELIEDVLLELKLLHKLLDESAPVVREAAEPGADETAKLACAALLQSFYNGVESIFETLAERLDGGRPTGDGRHAALLGRMARATDSRPPVLSGPLGKAFEQYLEFRNSFRYSHYFRLDWPLAAALVAQCGKTLDRLEAELDHLVREQGKCRLLGRPTPAGLPEYWFAPPAKARQARWEAARGPCVLAAIVGIALGVGLSAAVQYGRVHARRKDIPAAEMRTFAALLAGKLQPWRAEGPIRHAIGVLEFFDRDDWRFSFAGDQWNQSGDVTGRSPSLGAAATFAFVDGELRKIEVRTGWEQYVFTVHGGRVVRSAQYELSSGRPQGVVEFDEAGRPTCQSRWTQDPAGLTRRDVYYRDGKAIARVVSRPPGQARGVTVRTGDGPDQTVTFTATPAGPLAADPNTPALTDLPPAAATQPAGP